MAKKRYVHKTVRPSDGGRLLTATAEETVGISNYVEKLNFRRELDGEVRREGWSPFVGYEQVSLDGGIGSKDVDLIHEFTDHLGQPRVIVASGGNIYSYVYHDGTSYFSNSPKEEASIIITKVGPTGSINEVDVVSKGYGYPSSSYITVSASDGQGAVFDIDVVGSYVDDVSIQSGGSGYSAGTIDSVTDTASDLQYLTLDIDRYEEEFGSDGKPYVDDSIEARGTGWREIASGQHYLGDGFEGVRRWECVESNGYVILNNGYDLPLIYRSDWDEATPLYGLRENRVASVGTIQSYAGRLLCADIVEVIEGYDLLISGETYGCVYDRPEFGSGIRTKRNQYSVMWSSYGQPWLFDQGQNVSIEKNSAEAIYDHEYFASNRNNATFNIGDPVYITGAGIHGGRLSLKTDSNAVLTGVTGSSVSNTFTKENHGLVDGERIRIVTISKGGGPVEGADYYVNYVSDDRFKLNREHVRSAIATAELVNVNPQGVGDLRFTIQDNGAGYTAASVSVGGYQFSGSVGPVVNVNSVGQVVSIDDTSGYEDVADEANEITISEPDGGEVDVTSYIEMMIIRPDLTENYRSIIDGAIAQVSSIGFTRDYASTLQRKIDVSGAATDTFNITLNGITLPVVTVGSIPNPMVKAKQDIVTTINAASDPVTARISGNFIIVTADSPDKNFELTVSAASTSSPATASATVSIQSPPEADPNQVIRYSVSIGNEDYELKYDPNSVSGQDFKIDSTSDQIASQFASLITQKSQSVSVKKNDAGLVLEAKIAGAGFEVSAETNDPEGSVTTSLVTQNSTGDATESQIDEAYIALYGTERRPIDSSSFNNPVSILGIEGPRVGIVANGYMLPQPTTTGPYSDIKYEIKFVLNENLGDQLKTTYTITYNFADYYNSKIWPAEGTSDYHRDMLGSAFLAGLDKEIRYHPALSSLIRFSTFGYTAKSSSGVFGIPYAYIFPKKDGDIVSIESIGREIGSGPQYNFNASDDPWSTVSSFTPIGGGWYTDDRVGIFFYDTSTEYPWIYLLQRPDGTSVGEWVPIGRLSEEANEFFVDGIAAYKTRPSDRRRVLLDAYADTTVTNSEMRRVVNQAGANLLDISLGAGYQDWQEDGTAILKMETIGEHLACYRENGYFTISNTGDVDSPFSFKTRYIGRNVPTFRHCILKIAGKKHVYVGNSGVHEISLTQPQPIPSVILAGATEFWRDISEEEAEYVFTSNNVLTSEYFIHLPKGYKSGSSVHTIAYDYKYNTISQIDAAFTAASSMRKPNTTQDPKPNDLADFSFIMALAADSGGHCLVQYGFTPAQAGAGPQYIYSRQGLSDEAIFPEARLRFGLIAFGDTFNEKDMRSYIFHASDAEADVNVEIYTAYTVSATDSEKYLFGEEDDEIKTVLLDDLANENAIPLYLRAPLFQDQIRVTGDKSIKFLGRTFEVAGIYDRAAMQMVGIGGGIDVSS